MYRVTIYNGSTATVIHEPSTKPNDPHLYRCSLVQGSSGEIDSLSFDILSNNPGYALLESRTTLIAVTDTRDNAVEFSGRVLTITPKMETSGLICKSVVCEDRLGFLCDSIQPYTPETTYEGDGTRTGVEEFLDLLLANHNAQVEAYKRIYRGTVSVATSTGNVTKGLNYETTWDCIKSKLLDSVGGEILLYAGADGKLYLDYVPELGSRGSATIEMGKNMRSISREIDPTSVITRLIPLGAKAGDGTDERINIASVNNQVIYLDDDAAKAQYGIVVGVVTWDDVTEPKNLMTKGQAWLKAQTFDERISLSALDLSLNGLEPDAIRRYNYYRVVNEPIGLDAYLRVVKRTVNIVNPTDITYEMGQRSRSMASVVTDTSNVAGSAAADAMAAINAELSKTVETLIAADATITNLKTQTAEIQIAIIGKADIEDLDAVTADIETLTAQTATLETAIIGKADITDLEAATAHIDDLSADVANIETILAGNVGTGNLQAIHITGDNVVIDEAVITDAMIANLSASKLTAGTLYTSLIQIASDQDEHLLIDGATLQIKDSRGTVRVQIGQDDSGDYSYYLWDANGHLMWSPTGVTAAGLNDGIIRDINVAEDAAISGDKLDITSVAQRLNEDGSITVEAGQVTIDGTKLDVAYQTITQKVTDIQSDAVAQITTYYALGTSSTEPPSDPIGGSVGGGVIVGMATVGTAIVGQSSSDSEVKTKAATVATVGTAIVGQALVGSVVLSSGWTTKRLTAQDGEYLWTAGLVEYLDGTTTWTTPTCLTDGLVREKTTTLQTALNVVQGQISSKVWQTDIISAVDPLGQEINILQDQYTTLSQTMDGLQVEVGDLTTTVSENYRKLDSKLTEISVTAEGLSTQVSSVQTAIDGVQTTTETLSSRIEQLADSISLSVTGSLGGTASIVLSVDGQETSHSLDLSEVRTAFANDTSAVTISAGTVAFAANTLLVDSDNFTLDQNGNVSVAGTITAQSGSIIGDWGITSGKIFATSPVYQNTDGKYPVAAMQVPGGMDGTANWVFAAGGTSHDNYTDCPFRVSKDGVAYVQKLNIPYDTDASGGYATIRAQNYGDGAGLKIDCSFILDVGNYIRCNLPYGDFILQEAILGVTSDSNLSIGAGIPAHSMDDNSGNTHIHGRWIKLICGTEGEGQVQLIKERTGDLRTVFRPASNGGAYLGTSSYRWASVYCSDGAFNGSDRKLKDHIAYLDEVEKVEDFVMALRPVEYTLKSGTGKRTHMGLYAQDVAQAARSTIGDLAAYQAARRGLEEEELPYTQDTPDEELDWSLNYSELIAPLIAVIQKQSHKLVELEERINGIEGNNVS